MTSARAENRPHSNAVIYVVTAAALALVAALGVHGALGSPPPSQPFPDPAAALGTTGIPAGSCLVEVPDSTTITPSTQNHVPGDLVPSSSGGSVFFPEGSCPQPAHVQQYDAALRAEYSSAFLSLENGSTYVLYGAGPTGYSYINGTQRFMYTVSFVLLSTQTGPCGPRLLGEIQVTYLYESYQGPLDLNHPSAAAVPPDILNICGS